MGQEFFIKSENLESKVRQLLPSQGGLGAGFDLTGSTQIIPIVDLTESAEGSNLRIDLQSAISLDNSTAFSVSNTSTTLINNTGFYRIFGNLSYSVGSGTAHSAKFQLTDGITSKNIFDIGYIALGITGITVTPYDFIVFLEAGQSLVAVTNNTAVTLTGITRQVATIDGQLVNPI